MNKHLYDSYQKLGETAKSELQFKLKDSPVGLLFLDFLKSCSNRNFRNAEVVNHIYKYETKKTSYNILENRYFKLRKKFLDEFFSESSNARELLTPEELELYKCKQLIRDNEKETGYQYLSELEKKCWEKNIFELLPSIIDQLIFCNQSFNRLERNSSLYERLANAIALQTDINRCIMLSRKIYEINYTEGIKQAKRELDLLRDLAVKHKAFPRFMMCYHHVSLYYKLGSKDYIDDMQVVSRHFAQFKKLNSEFPLMPLIGYRANYTSYQHFHFKQIAVFYHYNRCEFEDAYIVMKELWDMVEEEGTIFKLYKTDSLYFNMLKAQLAAERYQEAVGTTDLFISFLKENNQAERLSYAYTQKAMVYVEGYSKIKSADFDFFLNKIDEYIKTLKNNNNVQTSIGEALTLQSKIHFLKKDYDKALKVIAKDEVRNYLNSFDLYDFFIELYSEENKKASKTSITELKKKISKRRYGAKQPNLLFQLKWLAKMYDF